MALHAGGARHRAPLGVPADRLARAPARTRRNRCRPAGAATSRPDCRASGVAMEFGTVAQRISGYHRIPDEVYETPAWPCAALLQHVAIGRAWDPGAGPGAMVAAFTRLGVEIVGTTTDFFTTEPPSDVDTLVCNPPYGHGGSLAVRFIERALALP